jgi:antitoxin (DNA-binding transcriptional repressor) of toxin-antitoxin stability system
MKVTEKLTEAELAERLDDVLDRASKGEEFAIERDGEVIAVIRPLAPGEAAAAVTTASAYRGTTWEEFTSRVRNLDPPGDGFADDLEAIQASQGVVEMPEWPD